MSRDFSKALENIRKAMNAQDEEFRHAIGLGPKKHKPQPVIPSLKPEPQPKTSQDDSSGGLDADRFIKTSITQDTKPEFVEVIQQKDSQHSWLYNEVAKAVHNASGNNPNTKVVAVFVPVVQSGHEFKDLPVHETVELPPVNEEDFNLEDEIDFQDDPVTTDAMPEDSQEPALPDTVPNDSQEPAFPDDVPEDSQEPALPDDVPEASQEPAFPDEVPDIPEELSAEPEQAEHLDELLPESLDHPDPELAEAFTTMEGKLDEQIAAESELPEEFVNSPVEADNDALPDLVLPDELDDDEVVDDLDLDESSEDRHEN